MRTLPTMADHGRWCTFIDLYRTMVTMATMAAATVDTTTMVCNLTRLCEPCWGAGAVNG